MLDYLCVFRRNGVVIYDESSFDDFGDGVSLPGAVTKLVTEELMRSAQPPASGHRDIEPVQHVWWRLSPPDLGLVFVAVASRHLVDSLRWIDAMLQLFSAELAKQCGGDVEAFAR